MKLKRLLSIVLCLCMFVSMMSTSAFAEEAHEHDWVLVSSKDPTCTASGSIHKECSSCEAVSIKPVDPTGHTWDEGEVTKEATCTQTGVRTFKCTAGCGASRTETIDVLPHDWDDGTVSLEPSCISSGVLTLDCKNCEAISTQSIEPKGHTWDEGVVTKEASCTEAGVRTFSCTVNDCGATRTEAIDVLPHPWDEGTVSLEPTCTSAGVLTLDCTTCEAVSTQSIEATGHTWDDGTVSLEPTCTSAGVLTLDCKNCEAISTKSIEATGHTWDDGTVTKAPTTEAEGVMTYTCTVSECGASRTEAIAKLRTFSAAIGADSGTYNGAVHTPAILVSDGSTSLTPGTDYVLSWSAEPKNAGSYTVTVTGINGYAECVQTFSYTINQAPVTVTATAASKKFGTSDPVFPYTASGLVAGEVLSGKLGRTKGEDSGTYQITIGNLVAKNPNYAITFVPADFVITPTPAESVINKIKGLRWLPGGQVDPGNEHQRSEVLKVWNAYNRLSATEKAKVPAKLSDWLYNLVSNTDYAIISGNGATWYKGKSSGISFTAIDPVGKFAGVRVDGELIDLDDYWYSGEDETCVVTLKPSYLTNLGFGRHEISICFWNGYAPGYFYIMEADGSPPTGDTANFPLWGSMMLLSAMGMMAAAGIILKRKKNEE